MKAIISSVIMIVFVIAGAVGADFLKNSSTPPTDAVSDPASKKKAEGKSPSKDKKAEKDDKGKGGDDYQDGSAVSYFQFSRQFVVPVVEGGTVTALVLMDINLELDGGGASEVYTMEPKLRDAVMRALMALSHDGVFGDEFTDPETYDRIRDTVRRAADGVSPKAVRNVLIMDIARQDRQ